MKKYAIIAIATVALLVAGIAKTIANELQQRGKVVRVKYSIPVTYRLS